MGSMGKAQVWLRGKEEAELLGGEVKQVKRTDRLKLLQVFESEEKKKLKLNPVNASEPKEG